jgi:phospholipid/cholesterol/gamma-HCH transport system substrate-binding protein
METHSQKFKIRLGLFIAVGLALFVLAIFIIGKQKNLFNPVFKLTSTFYNVSGLQVGNNVRFSGINVGTVDNIKIITDSTVRVDMLIKKDVQQFIKSDCEVAIGSEGLIGDRLLVISQGSSDASLAKEGQQLVSAEPVETDAIMASLQVTAGNAEIITQQLAEIMIKVNSGNGTLGKLIQDSTIAENFNQTIMNLKKSSKGLDENMEAAKHNFLLKGYFNKKAKAAEQKKKDGEEKKIDEKKEEERKVKEKNEKK